MELIMAPTTVGIAAAAKAMQDEGLCETVKVSGLGLPAEMVEFTLNGCAPEFALWSFVDLGYLTYHVAYKLATGELQGVEGETFEAGRMGSYTIEKDPTRDAWSARPDGITGVEAVQRSRLTQAPVATAETDAHTEAIPALRKYVDKGSHPRRWSARPDGTVHGLQCGERRPRIRRIWRICADKKSAQIRQIRRIRGLLLLTWRAAIVIEAE
jgi:hypothetical protein